MTRAGQQLLNTDIRGLARALREAAGIPDFEELPAPIAWDYYAERIVAIENEAAWPQTPEGEQALAVALLSYRRPDYPAAPLSRDDMALREARAILVALRETRRAVE